MRGKEIGSRMGARVASVVAVAAIVASVSATSVSAGGADESQVRFLASVSGAATVALDIDGTWMNQGCRLHALGDGRETVAFATTKPQLVLAFDPRRQGHYMVQPDWRAPARWRGQAIRTGTLQIDVQKATGDREMCKSAPTTLTAPATGCGASSGSSRPTLLWIYGTTGFDRSRPAPGRTVPVSVPSFWPSLYSGSYTLFAWLKGLAPCPSSTSAMRYTLGRGTGSWGVLDGTNMAGFSNGSVRSSGEWKPMLPARFWTKKSFTVSATYSWTINVRVSGRGVATVGTETHRVSWKATFERTAKR